MKPIIHNLRRIVAGVFGLVGLGAVILSCAEERPLAPGPVSWQAYVSYTSYGRDSTGKPHTYSFVYVWDLDSVSVVDSLPLPVACQSMVSSADGEAVFLLMGDQQGNPTVTRMSTLGWHQEWRSDALRPGLDWPYGDLFLLNSGHWLRYNQQIVSTQDGIIINTIPDSLVPLGGSANNLEVAVGLRRGSSHFSELRRYNPLSGACSGAYHPHLKSGKQVDGTKYAVLHPDGRRVLTFAIDDQFAAWFLVGDLVTGETLIEDFLGFAASSGSEIVITEDGETAIVSNVETLDLYDLGKQTKLRRFTDEDFSYSATGDPGVLFGHLVLYETDSKFLVGGSSSWYTLGFVHAVGFTPLERISTIPGPLWEYLVALNGFTVVPARK